jgi:hypothetical protein
VVQRSSLHIVNRESDSLDFRKPLDHGRYRSGAKVTPSSGTCSSLHRVDLPARGAHPLRRASSLPAKTAITGPCRSSSRKPASSSAGGADYADRDGITFSSTCTCGGVPEPCVPPDEGRIIGQTHSVSGASTTLIASRNASACRARSAVSVPARCSKLRAVILEQDQTGADIRDLPSCRGTGGTSKCM